MGVEFCAVRPTRGPRALEQGAAGPDFREFTFRDCMKKGRRVVIRYSSRYEKAFPNRSIRCRMVIHRASFAPAKELGRPRIHSPRKIL